MSSGVTTRLADGISRAAYQTLDHRQPPSTHSAVQKVAKMSPYEARPTDAGGDSNGDGAHANADHPQSDPPPLPRQRREEVARIKARRDFLTGIALLMLVVLLWTASNFITNTVLTSGYDKPFAMTYLCTSAFSLYLVPFALAASTPRGRRTTGRSSTEAPEAGASTGTDEGSDDKDQVQSFWAKLGFRLPDSGIRNGRRGRYQALPRGVETREASAATQSPSDGLRHRQQARTMPDPATDETLNDDVEDHAASASLLPEDPSQPTMIDSPSTSPPPLTLRETVIVAAQFTPVWFAANWSINSGLGLTSVASGTTLSAASGLFTFALASVFGVERFSWAKLAAVVTSFVGVALVTNADSHLPVAIPGEADGVAAAAMHVTARSLDVAVAKAPANAPLGDFLSLASAFFYAIYVTLLKVKIGNEERVSMPLFFGFVGLLNLAGLWPLGVLLHWSGVEPIRLPSDRATWMGVGLNMAITFTSDFAYLLAMLKSSPLVATVGLSLTIPLAVLGDAARGGGGGKSLQANLGSIMVVLSFVAIGLADESAKERVEVERVVDASQEEEVVPSAMRTPAARATTRTVTEDAALPPPVEGVAGSMSR